MASTVNHLVACAGDAGYSGLAAFVQAEDERLLAVLSRSGYSHSFARSWWRRRSYPAPQYLP